MYKKLLQILPLHSLHKHDRDRPRKLDFHSGDISKSPIPEDHRSIYHVSTHLSSLEVHGHTKQGAGCGKRECQDSYTVLSNFIPTSFFFGVFDGHGQNGRHVASFISEEFVHTIKKHREAIYKVTNPESMESYIKMLFKTVDEKLNYSRIDTKNSGACCITVMIIRDSCYVANLGDCRAVLCRTNEMGQNVAIDLSADHKPALEREKRRILSHGGKVAPFCMNGEYVGPLRVWTSDGKSGVAMTRSMGDLDGRSVGLTAEPEVLRVELVQGDKFIILGSDGIWDVMTSEEACGFVLDHFAKGHCRKTLAKALVEEAKRRWDQKSRCSPTPYRDDITAVVAFPAFVQYHEVRSQMSSARSNYSAALSTAESARAISHSPPSG